MLYFGNAQHAIADLEQRGACAAQSLRQHGIQDGAVIALVLRNEPAFLEALVCIRCLHAIRVLVPWHLSAAEMHAIFQDVQPQVVIGHADVMGKITAALVDVPNSVTITVEPHPVLRHLLEGVRRKATGRELETGSPWTGKDAGKSLAISWAYLIDEADRALSIPTTAPRVIGISSGSTGQPKIVRHSGPAQWATSYSRRAFHRPKIHTSIVTAPLFHGAQYGVFSQAWYSNADIVLLPKFDAVDFLTQVERHRVNHAYLVPTMFVRLLRRKPSELAHYDVSSLNYILQAGALCSVAIKQRMIDWLGPVIWEAYGCTELSTISVCSSQEWQSRPGTIGQPSRHVVILDNDLNDCEPGQVGRVYVDVSQSSRPNYEGVELIRHAQRDAPLLGLGDAGYLDQDGYLYLVGRTDGLINTGRVKVYPLEIETALLEHPNVQDAVVFGVPDEEYGQRIGAALELGDSQQSLNPSLTAFLDDRLSAHKIPAQLWLFHEPIRLESGKLNRHALSQQIPASLLH